MIRIFVIICLVQLFALNAVSEESQVFRQHVGESFVKTFPDLESTLEVVDEQRDLPDSSWISRDKKSAQEDINELLDDVLVKLDIEEITDFRKEIREARDQIKKSQNSIAEYKRLRIEASDKTTLGMDNLPGFVTKEGYDAKIKYEKNRIARFKSHIKTTEKDLESFLKEAGLKLEKEDFQILLHTVNGDDFVDMKLTFETVKGISNQLAKLTKESGEDVETAKRYFGVYTVLLRILDRVQKNFVNDIDDTHIPKIEEYREAALRNIAEAESAIEKGGNRFILKQNIQSNQLTLQALNLYRDYLESQRATVTELNVMLQKDLLTADSTYNTVSLAAEVVDLLQTGINNFELLMSLDVPIIEGFENEMLRKEIVELTARMKTS